MALWEARILLPKQKALGRLAPNTPTQRACDLPLPRLELDDDICRDGFLLMGSFTLLCRRRHGACCVHSGRKGPGPGQTYTPCQTGRGGLLQNTSLHHAPFLHTFSYIK